MAIRVNITVSDGPDKGIVHEFSAGELILGRSGSDFVINDSKISGNHCKFIIDGNELWCEDLNSTNGTFINGKKITGKERLQNLDVVVIGLSKLSIATVEKLEEFKKINVPEPRAEIETDEEIIELAEEVSDEEATNLAPMPTPEQAPKLPAGNAKYGQSGVFRIDEIIKDEMETFSKWDHPATAEKTAGEPLGLAKIQIHLIVKQGPEDLQELVCTKPVTTLGRKNVDLRINDIDCSRKHAQIEITDNNQAFIKDAASTNGTFVNGVRISHQQLHDGDIVQIGKTIFEIEIKHPET